MPKSKLEAEGNSYFLKKYQPPVNLNEVFFGPDEETDHLLEDLRVKQDREHDPSLSPAVPCG